MFEVFENPDLNITPETDANDIEEWDSFNHINLILAIETEFGISLSVDEVQNFQKVGDIVSCLEQKDIAA